MPPCVTTSGRLEWKKFNAWRFMKLADYVIDFMVRRKVKHAFVISGGAVVHLVDSVARHPGMDYICPQHEQGGGAAADLYARITSNLGFTLTTSGPGTTNLVTSVCNAYFDSIPLVCISGQVARFRLKNNPALRQRGFQETDQVSVFKSITKYAKLITDPLTIREELEKAIFFATSGRPGPVLLDIPDDIQRVDIDPDSLIAFNPPPPIPPPSGQQIDQLFSLIHTAKRPMLILGAGIHSAKCQEKAIAFAKQFHLPVLLTWGGLDLLPYNHKLNLGAFGVCGPRGSNFAVQNADLVIALGTRLSQMITGGKQSLFSVGAKKVMVDIDAAELRKFNEASFRIDLPIEADLSSFFKQCEKWYLDCSPDMFSAWREQVFKWKHRYPICEERYYSIKDRVSPYVFMKEISPLMKEEDIIITDAGGNLSWTMQAIELKGKQRIFSAWNHSPMGFSVPASIGAALGGEGRDVICIIGDGGLMMCLQELGTIRRHNLPVKIFLFNNRGHGIQKQTIDNWLNSHYVAVDEATGLYFPDYKKIAESFQLPYFTINNHDQLLKSLDTIYNRPGPFFCNVEITENQKIVPMLKYGAGLDDLDPKIPETDLELIRQECLKLEEEACKL